MATFDSKGLLSISVEDLKKYTKDDLLKIAEFNKISMDKNLKKDEIRKKMMMIG